VDAVPHGLDPLAAEDSEDDHERVEEVTEVPAQLSSVEVLRDVVGTKQLHAHHGEDEYDDSQHEAEVAERSHRSTNDADQKIECRPRLGQLEHSQLNNTSAHITTIMLPSLVEVTLSVAPRLSVCPSVRPSRVANFLETGKL